MDQGDINGCNLGHSFCGGPANFSFKRPGIPASVTGDRKALPGFRPGEYISFIFHTDLFDRVCLTDFPLLAFLYGGEKPAQRVLCFPDVFPGRLLWGSDGQSLLDFSDFLGGGHRLALFSDHHRGAGSPRGGNQDLRHARSGGRMPALRHRHPLVSKQVLYHQCYSH